MAPGSSAARREGRPDYLDLATLSLDVPAATPPDALRTIDKLLALMDILADRTAQLHVALGSRITIEQAKGMLAERFGITTEEAFTILRAAARRRRLRIHALARHIVERRSEIER